MKSLERRKKILEIVNKHKEIKIKDIANILETKENNIRRDIRILSELGLLRKIYGGIRLNDNTDLIKKNYFNKINNEFEKKLIAEKAFELINENDSILLGPGTTVFKLAEILYNCDIKLNILTFSLPVAVLLSNKSNINLVLIGGELVRANYSFEGPLIGNILGYFTFDKAFMGVNGFSMEHGFTISSIRQATSIQAVAKLTEEIIFLVDYSKFLNKCFVKISTFENKLLKEKIKTIVTDRKVKSKYIDKLKSKQIKVIIA